MNIDLDLTSVDRSYCLSGGAAGSDLEWGKTARAAGHHVVHFSFRGHKSNAPPDEIVTLTEQQLEQSDIQCRRASVALKRPFPCRSAMVTNLLRRNWYQVATAQSCYAIIGFEDVQWGATISLGTIVQPSPIKGGTAWAVEMYKGHHSNACYVFEQNLAQWFQWAGSGWQCIYSPPKPVGVYAGIGTRDLKPIGRLAIRVLMDQWAETGEQAEINARRRFEDRTRLLAHGRRC